MKKSSDYYQLLDKNGELTVNFKLNELPSLFHFSSCNLFAIKQLMNAEIVAAYPSAFNDPFDCLPYYDKDVISKFAKKKYQERKEYFGEASEIEAGEMINGIVENICFEIQNYCRIFCLALNGDDEYMWGHYADNHRGFALSYDAVQLEKCAQDYYKRLDNQISYAEPCLKPVLYDDRSVDVTTIMLEELARTIDKICGVQCSERHEKDTTYANALVMYKKKRWEQEHEWRLSVLDTIEYAENGGPLYKKIGICKPTAIYLGMRMDQSNQDLLCSIARQLNIPVYKMEIRMNNQCSYLQPKQIQ